MIRGKMMSYLKVNEASVTQTSFTVNIIIA